MKTYTTTLPIGARTMYVGMDSIVVARPDAVIFVSANLGLVELGLFILSVRSRRDKRGALTADVFYSTILKSELATAGYRLSGAGLYQFEDVTKMTHLKALDLSSMDKFVAEVLSAAFLDIATNVTHVTFVAASGASTVSVLV